MTSCVTLSRVQLKLLVIQMSNTKLYLPVAFTVALGEGVSAAVGIGVGASIGVGVGVGAGSGVGDMALVSAHNG